MNALTLEEVEDRISEIYHWFAREAPGITPKEEGELGVLWSLVYDQVDDDGNERGV